MEYELFGTEEEYSQIGRVYVGGSPYQKLRSKVYRGKIEINGEKIYWGEIEEILRDQYYFEGGNAVYDYYKDKDFMTWKNKLSAKKLKDIIFTAIFDEI